MAAGFASSVREFLTTDKDHIVGRLVTAIANSGFESQQSRQIRVWAEEVDVLKTQLRLLVCEDPRVGLWHIILEYEIPRRQKRPDVIFLAHDIVMVLEFKFAATSFEASSRWQAEDYALNLRDFHAESASRRIIPILCAADAKLPDAMQNFLLSDSVANLQTTNSEKLGACLKRCFDAFQRKQEMPIQADEWLNSAYRPTLTVIEAAERLYDRQDVREISHSYAENLDKTTDMLMNIIAGSKAQRKHTICFVTGVPGAGKTLTGLNVVHDPAIRSKQGPSGIFLSGNGPLVKIIREAIVQNQMRQGHKRRECKYEVEIFIQNVHTFLSHHHENPDAVPHEHVVIFDEAQRAWDRKQMRRKRSLDISEPAQLLEVMERFSDWAVIIALVGGGQEIYLGEAGLEEWGRALLSSQKKWSVVASPEALSGGASVADHRLFDDQTALNMEVVAEPLFHLSVSVRSHRAQLIAEWVNALLELDTIRTFEKLPDTREFPVVVTRDLEDARRWLRLRTFSDRNLRCGLISTSEDQRLRAYGLEASSNFRSDYPFEKWYLAGPDDIRSSFQLEVAASEFECQGLELDWVGVCWGGDLTPDETGEEWEYRNFRGSKWQRCRQAVEQEYIRNRYRVLLTRARCGMVIWVPPGDESDPTRDPHRFNRVYDLIKAAGVPNLEISELE